MTPETAIVFLIIIAGVAMLVLAVFHAFAIWKFNALLEAIKGEFADDEDRGE